MRGSHAKSKSYTQSVGLPSVIGERQWRDTRTFVCFVHRPDKISKPLGSPSLVSAPDRYKTHERPPVCTSARLRPRCPHIVEGGLETRKPAASSELGSVGTRSSHQRSQKRFRKRAGPEHQALPAPSIVRRPVSTLRRCSYQLRSRGTRQLTRSVF